jgi:MATE family multidrug resistance protein
MAVLLNASYVFDLLGFEGEATVYSQQYIDIMFVGIYILGLLDANRRLLNCMGYQNGPMLIQITCTFMHILWCYLFVDVWLFGVRGPAYATVLTYAINLVALYVYTERFTSERLRREAWFLPDRACFDRKGLSQYMIMAVPSIGMLCLEWWSFELMTLYSAFISMQATAAQIISLNTAVISFMPAFGIQYAVSALIG